MAADPATYFDLYLEPLAALLKPDDVTDIYINRPGEAWVETLGGQIERIEQPRLSESMLWRMARQVASLTHQGISREHPLLAAMLPDGTRVQVIAPPATRGPLALALRKPATPDLRLSDYEASGAFSDVSVDGAVSPGEQALKELYEKRQWASFLGAAVRARKTILISGGTSSGKTTFLNALLREVDQRERLVLIEDTPEVVIEHQNAVGLVAVRGGLGEAIITTEDLLTASLRLRPDRIILGEIRGPEAFVFLRAVNTGHPGSITTIHADTPDRAVEQLALLAMTGSSIRRQEVVEYSTKVIDIIVQLERRDGPRRLSSLQWNRR